MKIIVDALQGKAKSDEDKRKKADENNTKAGRSKRRLKELLMCLADCPEVESIVDKVREVVDEESAGDSRSRVIDVKPQDGDNLVWSEDGRLEVVVVVYVAFPSQWRFPFKVLVDPGEKLRAKILKWEGKRKTARSKSSVGYSVYRNEWSDNIVEVAEGVVAKALEEAGGLDLKLNMDEIEDRARKMVDDGVRRTRGCSPAWDERMMMCCREEKQEEREPSELPTAILRQVEAREREIQGSIARRKALHRDNKAERDALQESQREIVVGVARDSVPVRVIEAVTGDCELAFSQAWAEKDGSGGVTLAVYAWNDGVLRTDYHLHLSDSELNAKLRGIASERKRLNEDYRVIDSEILRLKYIHDELVKCAEEAYAERAIEALGVRVSDVAKAVVA
jgi:hypothetical protein